MYTFLSLNDTRQHSDDGNGVGEAKVKKGETILYGVGSNNRYPYYTFVNYYLRKEIKSRKKNETRENDYPHHIQKMWQFFFSLSRRWALVCPFYSIAIAVLWTAIKFYSSHLTSIYVHRRSFRRKTIFHEIMNVHNVKSRRKNCYYVTKQTKNSSKSRMLYEILNEYHFGTTKLDHIFLFVN